MDFAYAQGNGAASTGAVSSLSANFAGAVTPGNLIVVGMDTNSSGTISVADSLGNALAPAIIKSGWGSASNQTVAIYWGIAASGVTGVNINLSAAGGLDLSIDEFKPLIAGAIGLDGTPQSGSGSSGLSLSTSPFALSGSGSLVVAVGRVQQATSATYSFTAGTGFTLTYVQQGANGINDQATEYLLGASGSITPTMTAGTGSASFWGMAAAAFRVTPSRFRRTLFDRAGSRGVA